jgi:uncharacterized MAPEG superfamily protein
MLLGFAVWTLLVLVTGDAAYRRAMRAHANCLENLPVFGALVLAAAVSGLDSLAIGTLAAITLAARVLQSGVHMLLPERNATIAVRFGFFLVQVMAMMSIATLLASAARHGAPFTRALGPS